MAKPKTRAKAAAKKADLLDANEKFTLAIVGENNDLYVLKHSDWAKSEFIVDDPTTTGEIRRMVDYGVYLAMVPDVTIGIGIECILVNAKAILKNNV